MRDSRNAGERVVALGTFDGVHRGHQRLIRSAGKIAKDLGVPLRVCTFDRHPLEVLRPGYSPELLSTIPEKAREMCAIGVNEMEMMHFDRATADLSPGEFLDRLRNRIDVRAIVAGWNYSFGCKGKGNAETLIQDGKTHGYQVQIVPPATLADGTVISSTLVRQKLREGDTGKAAELLGRPYTLTGTVAAGKKQGHGLGFPTANIETWRRKALPKYGVYTCLMETDTGTFPGVVNIGIQPTIPSGQVTVEAHALTGEPDLYGRKVRLTLLRMLREERKFESPESLKSQIEKDRAEALKLFDMA